MKFLQQLLLPLRLGSRVERELAEARRGLLDAQTAREYATAMVEYQSKRVARLTALLREEPSE